MDLDGFTAVNDTLEHDAGDAVLQEVAGRIRACLRGHDRAARLEGDKFVLMVTLARTRALKEAQTVVLRLIASINRPMNVKRKSVRIGCSIGVAFYPDECHQPPRRDHPG